LQQGDDNGSRLDDGEDEDDDSLNTISVPNSKDATRMLPMINCENTEETIAA